MTAQEKATEVLPTPTAAFKSIYTRILHVAEQKDKPEFACYVGLQSRFATLGRQLTRSHRADDGRISYVVMHFDESRYFTHLHDVRAHLAAIEVSP